MVKKCISFEDYKECVMSKKTQYKSQLMFRSRKHEVYTQRVNKIALSSNDDKRLQSYDGVNSFAHGSSVGLVCKAELLKKTWHLRKSFPPQFASFFVFNG